MCFYSHFPSILSEQYTETVVTPIFQPIVLASCIGKFSGMNCTLMDIIDTGREERPQDLFTDAQASVDVFVLH